MILERLESNIDLIQFTNAFNLVLDERLLNKHVLKSTTTVFYSGTLQSIQDDLFLDFKALKGLLLFLRNFKSFLHSTLNHYKWLRSLNSDVKIVDANYSNYGQLDEMKFMLYAEDVENLYDYPDEDICFFRQFPHDQAVFYYFIHLMYSRKVVEIRTCTLYYLLKAHLMTQKELNYFNFTLTKSLNRTRCDLEKKV